MRKLMLVAVMVVAGVVAGRAQAVSAPIYVPVPNVAVMPVFRAVVADRIEPVPAIVHSHRIPSDPTKRCPKFESMFREYGLKPVDVFSYIAWRESRCRIKAINILYNKNGTVKWALNKNGTFDSGLFQVNSGHAQAVRKVCGGGLDRLLILDCNLRFARYLLDNGGLHHWSMG